MNLGADYGYSEINDQIDSIESKASKDAKGKAINLEFKECPDNASDDAEEDTSLLKQAPAISTPDSDSEKGEPVYHEPVEVSCSIRNLEEKYLYPTNPDQSNEQPNEYADIPHVENVYSEPGDGQVEIKLSGLEVGYRPLASHYKDHKYAGLARSSAGESVSVVPPGLPERNRKCSEETIGKRSCGSEANAANRKVRYPCTSKRCVLGLIIFGSVVAVIGIGVFVLCLFGFCPGLINACSVNPCLNNATCGNNFGGYVCECTAGFIGSNCEIEEDECSSYPCEHGSSCEDLIAGYFCHCLPGYQGSYCQIDIDECICNPCLNGATCVDKVNSFICMCSSGYIGNECEIDFDECDSNPCTNNATCNDLVDGFGCQCTRGYEGVYCERDINECQSNPCYNNGTCSDLVDAYLCDCLPGYVGSNCKIDFDECYSEPCLNNATCIDEIDTYRCSCADGFSGSICETNNDECESGPCHNGGVCIDGINSYGCACGPGYTGLNCVIDIDECASDPCLNNGSCIDEVNMYHCLCEPGLGYYGKHCEKYYCTPNPCINSGECSIWNEGFNCSCRPDFFGHTCEIDERIPLEQVKNTTGTKKAFFAYMGGNQKVYMLSMDIFEPVILQNQHLSEGFVNPGSGISISPGEIYLHALTAGVSAKHPLYFTMSGNYGLVHNTAAQNGSESISRNAVVVTDGNYSLSFKGRIFDHNNYLLTSWCAVSIEGTMDPVVAFSAYSTMSFASLKTAVSFTTVIDTFTAPFYGTYYFTFSANVKNGLPFIYELKVNNKTQLGLVRKAITATNIDTLSRTALLSLNAQDAVQLSLAAGRIASSSEIYRETSFSGFLYKPAETNPRAWSVYKSGNWDSAEPKCPQTLIFDGILLDEGDHYNKTTGTVTIREDGVYYMSVNAGAFTNKRLRVDVVVNDINKGSLLRQNPWQDEADSLERSLILRLNIGDEVRVLADSFKDNDGFLWSDEIHKSTSFLGFLVYK